MSNKSISIIAYVTIIGWIISYMDYKKSQDKSPLVNYHLGQSLGLFIATFVLGIVVSIIASIIHPLSFLYYFVYPIYIILILLGIVAASNETQKPLPLIGKFFEGKFDFSK